MLIINGVKRSVGEFLKNPDIDGGTIDGTVIGGTTPAAATVTTLTTTGGIELGHASDTTLTRVSAGQIAVEGVNVIMNGGALGTPSSGTLSNCTASTESTKGVVELATTTEATKGTDTERAVTPAGSAAALANLKTQDCENVVEDLSWLPPVTFTWDPGSLDDGVGETSAAIAVPGAVLGSTIVQCVAPYDLQGITLNAWVDSANSCKARLQNETTGTIDLATGTWVMQGRRI